jgi:phosphocarrier protein
MPIQEIEIINKLGLHARASAKLTQVASRFPCDVTVARNGRKVNAKSIMGVMMLAATRGSTITLETSGPEADNAMAAMIILINNRFDEAE